MAVKIARLFGKGHLPIAKVLRTLQVEFITQICSKISNYADPKEIAKQTSNLDSHEGPVTHGASGAS